MCLLISTLKHLKPCRKGERCSFSTECLKGNSYHYCYIPRILSQCVHTLIAYFNITGHQTINLFSARTEGTSLS